MPTLFEQIIPRRKLVLMLSETAILSVVLFLGTSIPPLTSRPFPAGLDSVQLWQGILSCLSIAVLAQVSLSYNDLYDWRVAQNRAELPNRLLHACGYALVMLSVVVFVFPTLFRFPGLRDVSGETWKLILLLCLGFVALWFWRTGLHWFFYKWSLGERVLIFGSGPQAHGLARLIRENPFSGFEPVGLVRAPQDAPAPVADAGVSPGEQVLGDAPELARIARQKRTARVVIALEERRGTLPVAQLLECRMSGVLVEEKEAMYERIAGKMAIQSLRPSYLIFGSGFARHPIASVVKRAIDVVVSLIGLLLSSPVCVLVAILIKLDSKGPVFFTQERVGQGGQEFRVIKFRTMRTDAEKSGPVWAQKNDVRVTRIGRFLRLSRIDEIPQMLNVLAGKMSFVGPRPERPHFVTELSRQISFYPLRHTVKPGLTGWAQVNYPYGASVEDAEQKLRYDLYYIKNMSPLFDLTIILRTVGVILFGKGAR
jgi:sugar transferase (PEP-CTERM system associated)